MTVSSTTNRKTYTGDGVSTSFSTSPVVFFETSDLVVYVTTDATGAVETLVENTDYAVSGGDGAVGVISLAGGSSPYGALTAGTTLVIVRELPLVQESDFQNNELADAEVTETALDRLTMLAQQTSNKIDRALRQPQSDAAAISELPSKVDRASKLMAFDADGNPTPAENGVDAATTFMGTVLLATTADQARALLGSRRQSAVTMQREDPTATDVEWSVYDPTGTAIDISASTTDGFAEAHAYAQANNYALVVDGGGITTAKPNANVIAFLSSTRQTLGPGDAQVFDIRGANFTFAGQGLTSGTAVTVDSFSKGVLNFDGQIVCSHAGVALEFRPSTNHTSDSNKNQGVSDFFFRVVQNSSTASNAVAVKFNAQTGESLNGSNYTFEEINGGEVGAQFITAGTGVITGCRFNLWGVHDFLDNTGGIGVDVRTGVSASDFNIEMSTPVNASYSLKCNSDGCSYSLYDITSGAVKVLLDTSATGNIIHIYAPSASGLTLTDNSADSSNRVYFNGRCVTEAVIWDKTGDVTVAGVTAGTLAFEGRTSNVRRLASIKAVHSSINGTAGYLVFSTRISDSLTEQFVLNSSGLKPAADNTYDFGTAAERVANTFSRQLRPGAGGVIWTSGAGTPEAAVTAPVGSLFTRTDGGANTTLYVKESGAGNTGWVAK
jgi:hypothetical protein